MRNLAPEEPTNNPTKKRPLLAGLPDLQGSPAERLADLAQFVADGINDPDLDLKHRAVWERRVVAALRELNGSADKQGRRRLIREALELCGRGLYDGGSGIQLEGTPALKREASRRQQAIAYVRDADSELADALEQVDPLLVVHALKALGLGSGRRPKGMTVQPVNTALAAVYSALNLDRDASYFGRRAPNELP